MKTQKYRSILFITAMVAVELLLSLSSAARAASLVEGVATATPSLVHILITPKSLSQEGQSRTPQEGSSIEKMKNGMVTGSGVIISSDGYIYTIDLLLKNAERIQVWTSDKLRFDAKIVGRDSVQNIALLKIEASGLIAARVGNPMQTRLGESIFSAGMLPEEFEFNPVVTEGIISTLDFKNSAANIPLIQTTSQITPGMGGGGLFNEKGELLGLSSVLYVNKDLRQAMSFSMPIDHAMAVLPELKKYGRIRRSTIGIKVGELTKQLATELNIIDISGALVQAVAPGGPADKAGIRQGDVIVQFGQTQIKRNVDIFKAGGALEPGTVVSVKLWRDGQVKELPLTTRELLLD